MTAPQAASDLRALLDKFDQVRVQDGSPQGNSKENSPFDSSGKRASLGKKQSSGEAVSPLPAEVGTSEKRASADPQSPERESALSLNEPFTPSSQLSKTVQETILASPTSPPVPLDAVVPQVAENIADLPPWQAVGFQVPRRERGEWKGMLKTTITSKAKDRDPHIGTGILHGSLHDPAVRREIESSVQTKCIRVFVSATAKDTEWERNVLLSDVVPFLQEYSMKHRVDFLYFDLNFGSQNELLGREDLDLNRDLLQRCLKQSKGFAVLHIATQLYGPRPAPSRIPRAVMMKLLEAMPSAELKEVLEAHYKLDLNCASGKSRPWDSNKDMSPGKWDDGFAEYVLSAELKPGSPEYEELWAALRASGKSEDLGEDEGDGEASRGEESGLVLRSLVEEQVVQAVGSVAPEDRKEKLLVVGPRLLSTEGAEEGGETTVEGEADEEAQRMRARFHAELPQDCARVPCAPLERGPEVAPWTEEHAAYLRRVADGVCGEACGSLEQAVTAGAVRADAVVSEAQQHLRYAVATAEGFCETEHASSVLRAVNQYLHEGARGHVMVVHGRGGSGKTQVMARAVAEQAGAQVGGAVVARFVGLTLASRSVPALLESLVRQLARVYGKPCGDLEDWKQCQPQFAKALLEWPSAQHPLTLFLDGLDRLDDFQGGRRLEWLPVKGLADHVRLIVSTRPDNDVEVAARCESAGAGAEGQGSAGSRGLGGGFWCLSLLRRQVRAEALSCMDGPVDENEVVPLLLWQRGRRVTAEQEAALTRAVARRKAAEATGDGMLWLSMVAELMAGWCSDDGVKHALGCSVKEVVEGVLGRLQESHGSGVAGGIAAALCYCKGGVSEGELLHILSLDDDALASAYRLGGCVPRLRVMPARHAMSALAAMGALVSRRVDGSGLELVSWKHSSIRIFATAWLEAEEGAEGSRRRHEQLADFFSGAWAGKAKRYSPALAAVVQAERPEESGGERLVPRQPLVLQGSLLQRGAGLALNVRRLEELVYHLILCAREEAAVQELCSIEYMTAKQTSGMGVDLLSELSQAMQVFSESGDRLHSAMSFLRRNEKMLRNERMGEAPFQLAMQEPQSSPVKKMFVPESPVVQDRIGGKARLIEWLNKREEAFPCLMSLSEHDGQVNAVACSPDGTHVASGSSDNLIKICRLATGELATTLRGHSHWVNSIAFSADGELLVSGSVDTSVRVWDAKTGMERCPPLMGHQGPVNCVAISPDSSLVASAGTDKMIRVWELRPAVPDMPESTVVGEVSPMRSRGTPSLMARLCPCKCPGARKKAAASPPSATKVVEEGAEPPAVRVSGPVLRGVLKGHTSWVNACAFHPDGFTMVSGSNDEIKVWYLGNMSEKATMVGHDGPVNAVAFCGNGSIALSGGNDGVIKLWSLRDGFVEKGSFAGHLQSVTSLAVAQDGDSIVSGSSDKQVKLWQLSTMQEAGVLDGHSRGVKSVAFCPDGKAVLSGSSDGLVKVWERTKTAGPRRVKAHSHTVSAVAISRDGTRAGSASFDGSLRVWDAESGEEWSSSLKGHTDRVTCMAMSPDGSMLVSGSNDFTVRLWDAEEGREWKCLQGHTHRVTSVVFSADGGKVVSASIDKTVRMWEVSTGQRVGHALEGHVEGVSTVAISPDGRTIASGSYDNDVRLYGVADGSLEREPLKGHSNWLKALSFSPDSGTLASAGDDATIRLWAVDTGAPLKVMSGHSSWITWLSFSADGSTLVSSSQDDVRLWDIEAGQAKGQTLIGTCCALHARASAATGVAGGSWFVVTAALDMVRVYQVTPRKRRNDEVKLAACFFAPSPIRVVSACGASICAGCDTGDVLLLKAPFMAP